MKQQNGDYKSALDLIDRAIEKNVANPLMYEVISEMYLAKGNIYSIEKKDGVEFYKESLAYYEKSEKDSPHLVIKILYNLGNSFCERNEHKKSLKYCNKALDILHKNDSTYLICFILYMKMTALLHLDRQEEYIELRERNLIFFEISNRMDLLVNLENYSVENIY